MGNKVVVIGLILLLGIGVGILIQQQDIFSSKKPLQQAKDFSVEIGEKQPLIVVLSFDYEDLNTQKGKENLPSTFRVLDKHNATATFFILGITAEKNPVVIHDIYARSYSLGLHTYFHNFPVFKKEDAKMIAGIYNRSIEYEWDRSFKTGEAFYDDLKANQQVIMQATDNATLPKMFRCPSLVINWTGGPEYFEVLKKAGIQIDSSIYQDFSNPKPFYNKSGVIEIPVTISELWLVDLEKSMEIAAESSKENVPFVMIIHPHKLENDEFEKLDNFLTTLEKSYNVKYARLEEIPEIF